MEVSVCISSYSTTLAPPFSHKRALLLPFYCFLVVFSYQTEKRPYVFDVFDELAVRFILNQPDATFASAARLFFQLEQVIFIFLVLSREKRPNMSYGNRNACITRTRVRICFVNFWFFQHVQAHWFYLDFFTDTYDHLPKVGLTAVSKATVTRLSL